MMKRTLLTFSFVLFILSMLKAEEARLLRFPATNGEQLVFSYAGDLYSVDITGGTARKLTSHEGYEMFPRFSPDGTQIAFTGQYDGNTEVFLINAEGGIPKRLTYTATLSRDDIADRMGPNNIVMCWTPDGKNIVYRSRKATFNSFKGSLYIVPADGGLSVQLPLSYGGFCTYNAEGTKLAFNLVFREFRTWKYYQGGMADDIRIYDFENETVKQITDNPHQDIIPMWYKDEIYFLSDRDRTMNLFVYNTLTGEEKKVTDFNDYDIKFPSIGGDYIVFEKGGYIYKYNLVAREVSKVTVNIYNDFLAARTELKDASKLIQSGDISPKGERVVFSARGEIFSVPATKGITFNLTKSSGAHDRGVTCSPNGKYVAYLSDKSGEYQIYIQDYEGKEEPIQITSTNESYVFDIKWSPDSKKIAWNDRAQKIYYIDIETREVKTVYTSESYFIQSFEWSPDSRWIVFSDLMRNGMQKVFVCNLSDSKVTPITDSWYQSYSPVFSDDGKYIAFISDRDFDPIYSATEWNHAYQDMSRIYLIVLSKNSSSPFALENDTVKVNEEAKEENKSDKKNKDKKATEVDKEKLIQIDFEGIGNRIVSLPVKAAQYGSVSVVNNKVYYNQRSNGETKLMVYDLKEKEEKEIGSGMAYTISAGKNKMLVLKGKDWYIIDLPSSGVTLSDAVDVSELKTQVNLLEEWKQIFDESWRQMRDFFYVKNMHGVDWQAMHEKYGVLVPYVRHRNDLTYIIGEMIGELNIGHAYVLSGDRKEPERIKTGLLGAELSQHESGYVKIEKILDGVNWDSKYYSPLKAVGLNIKEGDYITSINGEKVNAVEDVFSLLIDKAGKEVEIGISSSPDESKAKTHIIKPIDDESDLYYYNWVMDNIRKVNEATEGQVGYIHIPDMGTDGLNEFAKFFYPQLDKKALIIDDRGNGGGNVSPMIIERLKREVTRANMRRNRTYGTPVPTKMMLGPKVLLVDRYSASDGDLFAYSFKKHNLGTVIGTRTWGGVVGITGSLPFVDGADLRRPEFASYSSEESEWIIEGYGVDPDIVIDNNPALEYKGIDEQLNKAIEVILEDLKDYKDLPDIPIPPDKSN